jgi:hypothetical protein
VLYKLKGLDPHDDSIRLVRYESHQLDCPECYIEFLCDRQRAGVRAETQDAIITSEFRR